MKTTPTLQEELEHYFDRLWPLCRSLTGQANRETLRILSEIIPLQIHETPSGTPCFDWTVPPEWNPREAWIKDASGCKIVDFSRHNLHLLGYSRPFSGKLHFSDLKKHLYTLPDQPDWIPYVVSYYQPRWGFCMTHRQYLSLDRDAYYQVHIDATHHEQGSLTYGDVVLPGDTEEEVLLSTYICHPSMANDQISGMLVAAFLYRALAQWKRRRYTYRFVFAPETIGALCYLHQKGRHLKAHTVAGWVVTCVGDKAPFTYKHTKRPNTLTNKTTLQVLRDSGEPFKELPFVPMGSDERQYASPGFDLPIGSLTRSHYWDFKEYHSSADNKNFISFPHLEESIATYLKVAKTLEENIQYQNRMPYGEVQLGKRNLYPTLGRGNNKEPMVEAYQWLLNCSDGEHDLIDIARRSGHSFDLLAQAAQTLVSEGLLKPIPNSPKKP